MTTTSKRLLELAEAYQQKADALRLAAAELNGHETGKARGTIDAKLQAAMTLRQVHQNGSGPHRRPQQMQERRAAMGALLAKGLDTSQALRAALAEQGFPVDNATIVSDLHAVGATKIGHTQKARWALPDETASQPDTPPRRAKRKKTVKQSSSDVKKAQRRRTAQVLKRVERAEAPVSPAVIGRSAGALLRRGYLAKTAEGYTRTNKEFVV